MLKHLLAVLLFSVALTAQAGKLSQLVAKMPLPIKQAVVVIACAATCLVGLNPQSAEAYYEQQSLPPFKELMRGGGSGPGHSFLATKLGINVRGDSAYGSFLNIDTRIVARDGDSSGEQVHVEHFDGHLARMYNRPEGMTYSQANRLEYALTVAGVDYYDKRSFDLEDGTEGFKTAHLHWMGFDSSFVILKVGVGSLGFVKTGEFEQADLEYWAGDGADFSYVFFVTHGFGVALQPSDSRLSLGVKALQSRTLMGDIDFADGIDGDFVAIWESAEADLEWSLTKGSDADVRLGIGASIYRQRINADAATGERFSQNKKGHRIQGHLALYID